MSQKSKKNLKLCFAVQVQSGTNEADTDKQKNVRLMQVARKEEFERSKPQSLRKGFNLQLKDENTDSEVIELSFVDTGKEDRTGWENLQREKKQLG